MGGRLALAVCLSVWPWLAGSDSPSPGKLEEEEGLPKSNRKLAVGACS